MNEWLQLEFHSIFCLLQAGDFTLFKDPYVDLDYVGFLQFEIEMTPSSIRTGELPGRWAWVASGRLQTTDYTLRNICLAERKYRPYAYDVILSSGTWTG